VADHRFGIDVGGTGIKGAVVDVEAGRLVSQRVRVLTPKPATPEAVLPVAAKLVTDESFTGAVGCAFPSVIKDGAAQTAANIDKAWIGASVVDGLTNELTGCRVTAVNDADAAGLAEMRFGVGRDLRGVVVMLTVGTGIGSAVFLDGDLVPNTELGHLEVDGHDAETRASEIARERDDLSWHKWAKRFSDYLHALENVLWPDLIIIGGGISKKPEKFLDLLEARTKVVVATLANEAGIIGAALRAE
jgi:polyphosphate glucokinase